MCRTGLFQSVTGSGSHLAHLREEGDWDLDLKSEQSKEMLCLYSQGLKSEEVQLVLHMTASGQLTKQALAASFPQPCTSKASFIFRNLST